MDCERFDQHVIDELYDELDELTHAALERHVAGCSRCAGVLSGLRATRSVAILPLVEPPDDLEARIFAAVEKSTGGNAPVAVAAAAPPRSQQDGAVIRVLRWAVRPQLAMAAAFLLLIGASVVLFRGSAKEAAPASAVAEAQRAAAPAATATAAAADMPAAAPPAAQARVEDGNGEGKDAKIAAGEPQATAAPAASMATAGGAGDAGAPQQQVVAARAAAHAAPAAASMLEAEKKPADQVAAGAPAGAKAAKAKVAADADMGGMNPRAPAAPAPPAPKAAPVKTLGFAP